METELQRKHKVSTHLRELLKFDVHSVEEITKWLETNAVKKRDIDRRTVSKRLLSRMIAAQIALKAAKDGDIAAAREVMDRTEGKVPDKLIGSLTKNVNIRIELTGEPQQVVVPGEVVTRELMSPELSDLDSDTSK